MKQKVEQKYRAVKLRTRTLYKSVTKTILSYPLRSFFGVLGLLFLLIISGNIIGKPHGKSITEETPAKAVQVYGIGSAPRIQVTATVEKSGVVKIIAQSGGIVQNIYKSEGQEVRRGDWIVGLSTNYQGGNIQSVTRQIAQKNYDFANDNYDAQKDMIAKQRSIADAQQTQASDLRNITNNSIDDTQNLINLDNDILSSLDTQINQISPIATDSATQALLSQAKQGKAGVLAGLNSLNVAIANAQYQVNTDKSPTQLSNLAHDLTLKQLDIQQKSLDLNRELAKLNLTVAQISESLMYPASPIVGVVERVYVQVGQNVSSGTLLSTITGNKTISTIVASLPGDTAKNISRLETSKIWLGKTSIEVVPRYISTEPTESSLHAVLFSIPEEDESLVTNDSSVIVEIPIGSSGSTSAIPYVPLDAVYQTQDASYVYVASQSAQGKFLAQSKKVTLGTVFGQFVEVTKGLMAKDQVINSRNVIDGDLVTINN
jgi:multidrug efflux pump subunit AcrA (membrane-fusion protein)